MESPPPPPPPAATMEPLPQPPPPQQQEHNGAASAASSPTAPPPPTWNRKNPAIRRILADVRELALEPSDQYAAKPVEDNMFEWHFTIRGPAGTDFEGGRYHGKILLPSDYPYKPPNIVFLTPTGRWETKTKICLSISAYHPELWQPAWGVRTILEALISFMPTPADGAVGAVDATPELRKRFARESLSYSHDLMPQLLELGTGSAKSSAQYKDAIAQMHFHAPVESSPNTPNASPAVAPAVAPAADVTSSALPPPPPAPPLTNDTHQTPSISPLPPSVTPTVTEPVSRNGNAAQPVVVVPPPPAVLVTQAAPPRPPPDRVDDMLRTVSWALFSFLMMVLYRKLLFTVNSY